MKISNRTTTLALLTLKNGLSNNSGSLALGQQRPQAIPYQIRRLTNSLEPTQYGYFNVDIDSNKGRLGFLTGNGACDGRRVLHGIFVVELDGSTEPDLICLPLTSYPLNLSMSLWGRAQHRNIIYDDIMGLPHSRLNEC